MRRKTPEDFWQQVKSVDGCEVYTGKLKRGYGYTAWRRQPVYAHRLAFYFRMGRWPEGIMRHLCSRKDCVLHVVEGTQSENMRDCVVDGNHPHARKTHCPKGHPYDEENTTRYGGTRQCRACRAAAARAKRARQKVAP